MKQFKNIIRYRNRNTELSEKKGMWEKKQFENKLGQF